MKCRFSYKNKMVNLLQDLLKKLVLWFNNKINVVYSILIILKVCLPQKSFNNKILYSRHHLADPLFQLLRQATISNTMWIFCLVASAAVADWSVFYFILKNLKNILINDFHLHCYIESYRLYKCKWKFYKDWS